MVIGLAGVSTEDEFTTDKDIIENPGDIKIDNETRDIDLPDRVKSPDITLKVDSLTSALVILTVGIAAGIIAGIRFFGSGLSIYSQNLIFKTVTFFGLWAIISIMASDLIFSIDIFGVLIWLGLTLIFALGFILHIQGTGDS